MVHADLGTGILFFLFSSTFLLSYLLFFRESKIRKFMKTQPGPPMLPIIGNALDFAEPEKVLTENIKWRQVYGDRVRCSVGPLNYLGLANPQDIEKVLTSPVLLTKARVYDLVMPWLGEGLLTSAGKKWHTRRKLLTPAFHFQILETFQNVFNEQSQVLVEICMDLCKKGENIELHSLISRCTLDIICETAMGQKLNCQTNLANTYAEATVKETALMYQRSVRPWYLFESLYKLSSLYRQEKANRKILMDFVNQVIQERKAQMQRETPKVGNVDNQEEIYSKKRAAFLDLLLQLQISGEADLSDDDIREETNTFLFEGHDTTGSSLIWTFFLLGTHPEEQEKVHQELDSIFGDDRHSPVSSKDLANMKYMECCIKEALRMYPSVPFWGRKVTQDFRLDENTLVPAGMDLVVIPSLVHRHPDFYPEPEEFRPSRHFPENTARRHPYAYIPFSAGPRNCIGQKFAMNEEKIIVANVLRHFKFHVLNPETVIPMPEIVTRPKDEIQFRFEMR